MGFRRGDTWRCGVARPGTTTRYMTEVKTVAEDKKKISEAKQLGIEMVQWIRARKVKLIGMKEGAEYHRDSCARQIANKSPFIMKGKTEEQIRAYYKTIFDFRGYEAEIRWCEELQRGLTQKEQDLMCKFNLSEAEVKGK